MQQGECGMGCFSNPLLWSRKKKLETLEQKLQCLKEQENEILEALEELKK